MKKEYRQNTSYEEILADDIERWITVNGNHIPIKKGQSIQQALATFFSQQQFKKPKSKFIGKTFPPEDEVYSEANRLAVWWAASENIKTKDRTMISMNGAWYLIEKFDDMDWGYLIVDALSTNKAREIFKEIEEYGRSRQVKSISVLVD